MKILVVGATGVVGRTAAEYFVEKTAAEVLGIAQRPIDLPGVGTSPSIWPIRQPRPSSSATTCEV